MKECKIVVSDTVKAVVEKAAMKVCNVLEVKYDAFNQAMNAVAGLSVLKELGIKVPEDKKPEVLQALHKLSNASALRQAISAEKKQGTKAGAIAAELLDL